MTNFVYLKLKQLLNILDKVLAKPKFYIYRCLDFRVIHCLGDFHVAMFEYIKQNKLLKKTKINCTIVGGGTAMGMVNPNSKTNALQIFKTKINNISKQDYIFLLLGEVDCGLCTAVLEHLKEPELALRECYRVLKRGGVAIYSVPFIWHLHEEPRDFYRFSKYGLKYLFEKVGFEIIEIKALSGFWVAFGQLAVYNIYRFIRRPLKYIAVLPALGLVIQGVS